MSSSKSFLRLALVIILTAATVHVYHTMFAATNSAMRPSTMNVMSNVQPGRFTPESGSGDAVSPSASRTTEPQSSTHVESIDVHEIAGNTVPKDDDVAPFVVSMSPAPSVSVSVAVSPPASSSASQSAVQLPQIARNSRRARRVGTANIIDWPDNVMSTKKCTRIGAWSDVCVYKNMCFDKVAWYLIGDAGAGQKFGDYAAHTKMHYPANDFKTGIVYPVRPVPPDDYGFFPFNGGGVQGQYIPPSRLVEQSKTGSVLWSDSVLWAPGFKYHLTNTYYFTTRMMPIYVARRLNASGLLTEPLPSLGPNDFIYNPSYKAERFQGEWLLTMQNITTGSNSTNVEFGSRDWENSINETNWMCFKQAVHVSFYPIGVPDPENAALYRQDVFRHFGITFPLGHPRPAKVLFWLRREVVGRAFANLDAMIAIVKAYGIEHTIVYDMPLPSVKEQVELWSSHGVVICAHGAGLMNLLFMPPMGAVIEVFPNQFHHNLYSALAVMMGVGHYPVHPSSGAPMWATEKSYWEYNCSKLAATEMPNLSGFCKSTKLNFHITVDLPDFEIAFVNAMVHIGTNVTLQYVAGAPPA